MRKLFSFSRNIAIINFSAHFCNNSESLLNSKGFRTVLHSFLQHFEKKHRRAYERITSCARKRNVTDYILRIIKLLYSLEIEDIVHDNETEQELFQYTDDLIALVEGLYNYWQRIERFSVIYNRYYGEGLQKVNYIEAINKFNNLVLSTYRTILTRLTNKRIRVFRQLNAGVNAAVVLQKVSWSNRELYHGLSRVLFIDSVILNPPVIIYPKQNRRESMFVEVDTNPLVGLQCNREEWFCYPALVGSSLAYVFFHKDFLSLGISLSNLFEIAPLEMCKNREPDLLYIFGYQDRKSQTVFYHDKEADVVIGYVSYDEAYDYFGYLKKMMLTLHNIRMIEQGKLPIHGAMVNVKLVNGQEKNIVIIGDSGAGKSETLEALRVLSGDYIKDMVIIFDDMGTFSLENGEIVAYGTEIGAFIRLDDLDIGYAYRQIDRSIFMNPDRENARVVLPVTNYTDITKGYPVDLVLYANNYETGEELEIFDDIETAKQIFIRGARQAKGTTNESGLVESFFANPFGPHQRELQTRILIDRYFEHLFKTNKKVGQIRTRLGLPGQEQQGPLHAAEKLFKYISQEEV